MSKQAPLMSNHANRAASQCKVIKVYRWQPGMAKPAMQQYEVNPAELKGIMLLDALEKIREVDPTLSYRRSCGGGVCGSDGMSINGKNGLACVTQLDSLPDEITLRPLPGFPVVRDLVVDMNQFYQHYYSVTPYLKTDSTPPETERLQTPQDRAKLDGLYECILCACCTGSCPSSWWNPDKFLGPAALLNGYRFIADSRDEHTSERLTRMEDAYSAYRCRGVMNCASVCPKGLNPTDAINKIKTGVAKKALSCSKKKS